MKNNLKCLEVWEAFAMTVSFFSINQAGNTANLNNEATNSMIQKFWDSTMTLTQNDDDDEDSNRLDMCTDISRKNCS